MLQASKRVFMTLLFLAAVAVPSTATARVPDRQSPASSAQEVSITVPQPQSSSGFDWGDAGIGAAVSVALLAAGSALVMGRRRDGRHPATS